MNKKILITLGALLIISNTACNNQNGLSLETSSDIVSNSSENNSISENNSTLNSENDSILNSESETTKEVSLIAPSGTPLLAMSKYIHENSYVNYTFAKGADPLTAAFSSKSHDIIVAPINLGANFYNKTGNYVLFETIVWGNLYVVSRNPITSFKELDKKEITIFGTNQTPDIVMKTLAAENEIEYTKNLVSDVEVANEEFLGGHCEYAVSAEPNLSVLKQKIDNLYVLDLQDEWQKITGSSSYPQASVFVNKDKVEELQVELDKIETSINTILDDIDYSTSCAMQTQLKGLGEEAIKSALPNSHIGIEENQKDAIEFYFNKLFDLGLGKTFGDKLPDENFYL